MRRTEQDPIGRLYTLVFEDNREPESRNPPDKSLRLAWGTPAAPCMAIGTPSMSILKLQKPPFVFRPAPFLPKSTVFEVLLAPASSQSSLDHFLPFRRMN